MNHIVIDYNIINKSNYVRIVPINSSNDYNIEINKLYPDITTNICDNIHYNCSEWYDRLLLDLKYKKFKSFRLDMKYSGLFELVSKHLPSQSGVEDTLSSYSPLLSKTLSRHYIHQICDLNLEKNTNSTVDYDKYILELNTFVKQKLISYINDNGDDKTSLIHDKGTYTHLLVENILYQEPISVEDENDNTNQIKGKNKKYNPNNGDREELRMGSIELTFNNIEQNKDLKYILTNEHIMAFLYYLSTILFNDDEFDIWFLKPTGEPLNYQKNEFGITLNEPKLIKTQYRYLFDALNINIDSYFKIYKNIKKPLLRDEDLDTMTNYKEFAFRSEPFSLEWDIENQYRLVNTPKFYIEDKYSHLAYNPNNPNTPWRGWEPTTTDSTPLFFDTLKNHTENYKKYKCDLKSLKKLTIIKNNITLVNLLYNETIKYFNEFEEVSKILLKTDIGKTLYERVYVDISNNSLDHINTLDDLDSIRQLIINLSPPKIDPICTKSPPTTETLSTGIETPRPSISSGEPSPLMPLNSPAMTFMKFNDEHLRLQHINLGTL